VSRDPEDFGKVRPRAGRDDRWCVDVRPYGWIYAVSGVAFTKQEDADSVLRIVRMDVSAGRSFEEAVNRFLSPKAKGNLLTRRYAEFLESKELEVKAGDLSPTTLREYKRLARGGGELTFFAERAVSEVTTGLLKDWSTWLAVRGLAAKSRRNVLGMLRTFFGWLREQGVVQHVPVFKLPPEGENRPDVLSPEEQGKVLAAIPEDARGVYLAMALLGVRPGEARALLARHVQGDSLIVEQAVKGGTRKAAIGPTKTRAVRTLPLPRALAAWVKKHAPKNPDAVLFSNPRTGIRWTHWALRDTWLKACRESIGRDVRLYEGTKHSAATAWKADGHEDRVVAAMLGHADLRSTARYARLSGQHLRAVVDGHVSVSRAGGGLGARTQAGHKPRNTQPPVKTGVKWRPQRDSNPCRGLERAGS
jgi:integrase